MAQTWDSTVPSTTTNIFTDNVNSRSNEESLRSNFSGTSYPLTPVQGQVCYRTDLEREYTFNGSIWVESNSTSTISNEVKLSRGSLTSLDDRLSVSINPDGTLKSDIDLNISEFIISGLVPTYVSTTSFTVPEDQTGVFTAGRMLRASLATDYVYSNISTSVYNSSPNTTTVTLKDAVLDSGLNKLAYTVIQKTNAESMSNIPAGNISSTNVQAAINELDDEKLGKDGGTMTGSLILAEDPTENLQATTKQYVDNNSGGGSVGVTNYIASGGKFGTPNGFVLPIESRIESISDKKIERTANDITLNPRKAVLVYDKVDGTTDKLEAVYPDSVASTVHRWIINGDATISSTVGTNNLTKTGSITVSDGRVGYAGLGAGGHYTAANATNIPAYSSAFTLRLLIDKFVSNGSVQCFYHDGVRKIACNASNNLLVGGVDTGYTLANGSSYIVEVKGAGNTTTGDVFVGGISVYSGAVVVNTAVVTPFILSNSSSAELCYSEIGYVEILSTQTLTQVGGEIADKLLFPVSYDKSEATYPAISAADKATVWHEWKCDETSGTAVADSAGTLNGVATGTTIVDSELGLGKARKFASASDYISLGAFSFTPQMTVIAMLTPNSAIGGRFFGTWGAAYPTFQSGTDGTAGVSIYTGTSYINSGVSCNVGIPNFLAYSLNSGMVSFYVNSKTPITMAGAWTSNISATNAMIGKSSDANYSFTGSIDYLLILPRALSQAEIAEMYDSFMSKSRKSIKDQLPADSISLGYAYAGSNGITDLNDADWGYGRREKTTKGNRIKALPFSSSTGTIAFANTFGTENIMTTAYFKSSISANSHTEINPNKTITHSTITFSSTGAGYVGGFAEVLEDD